MKLKMGPKNLILGAVALMVLVLPAYAQQTNTCTPAMITSVSPCMSFLTNSSANATSPSADCCNSLSSLTSSGMGCLCLIVTGSIPFRVPINRTTAVSLPRACNMPSVPVQCKANISPAPAPGVISLGPTLSPAASPSPQAPVVPEPTPSAQAPESDTPLSTPPSPAVAGEVPSATGGSRPTVTPSAAFRSYVVSPYLLLCGFGLLFVKCY